MNIRVKFFVLFVIIATFTFSVSYYITGLNVKKVVEKQTEQALSSSLYTNYSIVKNLIDGFQNNLSVQIKANDLINIIETKSSYDIEKSSNSIFSTLNLDYFTIVDSKNFIFSKTNYSEIDRNINIPSLENGRVYAFLTDKGLIILTKFINPKSESTNIIAGKLIDQHYLEKLYQDGVNISFYWNGKSFLSTNALFDGTLPTDLEISQNQNNQDFKPTSTYLINWKDRDYKIKFHTINNYSGGNLVLATMSSTLFEDQVFLDTRNNLFAFLSIFLMILLLLSYYISRDIMQPFYDLAEGIAKKDKYSIKSLLTRKDEIGSLANEFWNITEDVLKQQEQKEKINSLITHDLKTPLVAITRTLETIRDKDSIGKEQRVFFINLMIKHCNQSLELINNLLKVQKYELGKMNLFMGEEDFNQLVDDCFHGLKPIADQKNIFLTLITDKKIPKIMIDRTELLRVITNLLSNAIKYTQESGNIKVITRLTNNSAEVRITDDGRGIAVYEQKKIFNFYKTSVESTDAKEEQDISTGLGLYLCKQIVEAHGGEIGFESYKNKGSTFYFSIPIR
ncbi:MAG: HAMP domain-containing histidine kinase [Candidatus Sericytochromatia bacterium]|nr:HAMP domain-containing histidine kinase [Candidatus Sericytochromatia bacterium]